MDPVLTWPPEVLLAAQGIRVAFFDVDGVLTDGGLYYGPDGEALKRFHTLDGHGLKLLARAGIQVVVISGRDSAALRTRLAELGIQRCHLGVGQKVAMAEQTLAELSLSWDQTAAMGDDWPDLGVLRRAHFACAPPGAHREARALADYVTQAPGGGGAAREFCDLLLVASGRYRRSLESEAGTTP